MRAAGPRKAENKPRVSARLEPSSDHGGFIRLAVTNLGRGPAVDLEIEVECDEDDFNEHGAMPFRGTSAPIGLLHRGESDTYSLGANRTLFADPPMNPFVVVLRYKDLGGNSHQLRPRGQPGSFRLKHVAPATLVCGQGSGSHAPLGHWSSIAPTSVWVRAGHHSLVRLLRQHSSKPAFTVNAIPGRNPCIRAVLGGA